MTSLLVTNDFPPGVGGIESYLWELWRRLPAEEVAVLAIPGPGDQALDASVAMRVERTPQRVLLPTSGLLDRIERLAVDIDAGLVVLDPALPLGWLGARLRRPYGLVLHGAEITVPARVPGAAGTLRRVLEQASLVVAAGGYPAAEARRLSRALPRVCVIPPGVDTGRFRPLDPAERDAARDRFGLPRAARLLLSVSRLVPRKGMDTLIAAAARLGRERPDLVVAVAGEGRDHARLARLIRRSGAPVRLLGAVDDRDLPALYGCADVFAMLCRSRWGGLEQEGFGIVFLEASACAVPQVAGDSGGAAEAVVDGETGLVVRRPCDPVEVAAALSRLLDDAALRASLGGAARRRVEAGFTYDVLAPRLGAALREWA